MPLLILHLSDSHFKGDHSDDQLIARAPKLAAIANEYVDRASCCLVLFTGDIAWSGKAKEYEVAASFVSQTVEAVKDKLKADWVIPLAVPGNHDCDFNRDNLTRKTLVSGLSTGVVSGIDSSVTDACTGPQSAFFDWLSKSCPGIDTVEPRMLWAQHCQVDASKVTVFCLNTAWVSQLDEKQGQIVMPDKLHGMMSTPADFVVSMHHHTYPWMRAPQSRAFQTAVERSSDLILTGHDHETSQFVITRATGEQSRYVEGGVLHIANESRSELNAMLVDIPRKTFECNEYRWNHDHYERKQTAKNYDFVRLSRAAKGTWLSTSEHDSWMQDPGAPYSHPRKSQLTLNDILVPPAVREMKTDIDESGVRSEPVSPDDFEGFVMANPRLMLSGEARSGKTTAAKNVLAILRTAGFCPVYLQGRDCTKVDKLKDAIDKAVKEIYGPDSVAPFNQLDVDKRTIIIDDLQESPLNASAKLKVIEAACVLSGRTVVCCEDPLAFQLESLVGGDSEPADILDEFTFCELTEMSYLSRERMIVRWLRLGRETEISDEALAQETHRVEQLVDDVLQRGLVPAYPIIVLTVLQTLEAGVPVNSVAGTYGSLYEALITRNLVLSGQVPSIIAKRTFLGEVAYKMLSTGRKALDTGEMEQVYQDFREQKALSFDWREVVRGLVRTNVMVFRDTFCGFRYAFMYAFFVAEHLADMLGSRSQAQLVYDTIERLSKELHVTDSANIVLFMCYLSRDERLMDIMLQHAAGLYSEYEPSRMEDDIAFLKKMWVSPAQLSLKQESVFASREDIQRKRDAAAAATRQPTPVPVESGERRDKEHADIIQINNAIKSLQILGQIARNYAGALDKDTEKRIIAGCFDLGLRVQGFLLGFADEHLPEILAGTLEHLKNRHEDEDEGVLEQQARSLISQLMFAVCLSTVVRVSRAVGSYELLGVYDLVKTGQDSVATELIHLALLLDHRDLLPEPDIEKVNEMVKNDELPAAILRALVYRRFRVYPCKVPVKMRVCSLVGIVYKDSTFALAAPKRGN